MALHHAGVQVAGARGGNLLHRMAIPREAARVVVGLNVTGENGDGGMDRKTFQGLFEQRRLTRSRRTNEVQ